MKNSKVTVAIITCKRPLWLERLLLCLNEQVVADSLSVSILVVDNAIDAKTKDVVTKVAESSRYPITYRIEPTPGIVSARNKCVSDFLATDSDYLIFIDDDEWPSAPEWIGRLVQKQQEYQGDIVTSHVISVGEEGTPNWAVDLIYGKNTLVEGQQVTAFYTNNLLICRHVLQRMAPIFDNRFAMTGASDYHFALKATQAGYKAFYTDAPVIEEFPKSRANVKWFLRRGFRSGIGYTRSHLFEEGIIKAILRCTIMAGVRFLRGLYYCLAGAITMNKTTIVDGLFRLCSGFGTLSGFFGVKHNEYNTIHGK